MEDPSSSMDRDDPAYRGQSDYTLPLLKLYDPLVLGFAARFVWRCPTIPRSGSRASSFLHGNEGSWGLARGKLAGQVSQAPVEVAQLIDAVRNLVPLVCQNGLQLARDFVATASGAKGRQLGRLGQREIKLP